MSMMNITLKIFWNFILAGVCNIMLREATKYFQKMYELGYLQSHF